MLGGRIHRGRSAAAWIAALVVVPTTLSGCGSAGHAAGSSTTRPPVSSSSAGAPAATGTGPAPVYEVKVGSVRGLGRVLVNGQGLTLYMFVPDKQSSTSTCYGRCAAGWPPLLLPAGVTAPVAGPGAQPSLLGTTARTDGTTEVTYNRWPLYLWVGDSTPGQATGQAINSLGGLWYVLAPDGTLITRRP